MPTWNVSVQSIGRIGTEEPRFVVMLFDPQGPHIRGPDGGKDHAGYIEADVRRVLAEDHGLPNAAIDSLIENAKSYSPTTGKK
jgi:hypothetical protein